MLSILKPSEKPETLSMQIKLGNVTDPQIIELMEEHLAQMKATSPPESTHALELEKLNKPEVLFFTAWEGNALLGCGALKMLDEAHAELKAMRTKAEYQKLGIASALLETITMESAKRGIKRLSLETGSMDYFLPARKLYQKFGFTYCSPFSSYKEDPNSVFMTKLLR